MRVLDLFAGIGGFSLAAHWMGWETAAFVEWDKFCQKVLTKNFPNVPIYGDIKEFEYEKERSKTGSVNLICGGFPCQPFSTAGKRKGSGDDRYLWPEMLRVIREVRPSWVVGENVAGLLSMDGGAVFEEVCASLENEGYSVESFVLPAISVGKGHIRERIWIVAYPGETSNNIKGAVLLDGAQVCENITNGSCIWSQHDGNDKLNPRETGQYEKDKYPTFRGNDGVSCKLDEDRERSLGNAIVPQVAYEIFRAIEQAQK